VNVTVNKAIHSLNLLFAGGEDFPRSTVENWVQLPLCQKDTLSHILAVVKDVGPPQLVASGPEALSALRVASSTYSPVELGVGTPVPMDLASLSLPDGTVAGVDLVGALHEPVRGMVLDFENAMLQDADRWTEISRDSKSLIPYSDPMLKNRGPYHKFLKRLHEAGVLGYTTNCRGRVGAFSVSKKHKMVDGVRVERQRLVLDCRQTNALFRPSPHTELGSLQALSDLTLGPEQSLFLAGADIKDCFYAVSMPAEMGNFFCLEQDLSLEEARSIFGIQCSLPDSGWVSPCITVLPMGFSWSFYLVQHIHESTALSSLGLGRDHVVLDSSPAPDFSPHTILTMPYCDNVHCIGDDAVTVDRATKSVCKGLEALGFTLHEEQSATTEMETLGGVVDGQRGQVRTTGKRIAYLSAAFDYVQTIVVSVEDIQRLLGHAMVVCVLNRCGMSIFRRLYDFVSSCSSPRRLTHLECMECKIFSGILPLLFADLRKPWSEEVHITDASPTGFGICSRSLDPQLSQDIGKWNERLRFKRLPPEQWKPRRRAAGLDPFSDIGTAVSLGDGFDESYGYCNNELFPEVPHQVLNAPDWKTVKMGRWKRRSEHITLKEGRALAFCVKRLSRASKNRNHRHLIFVDSMALAFAVTKGRAHSFGLLRVCQQLSALSLACGFSLRLRWVPSELNCADGPSRGQKHPGPFQKGEFSALDSADTSAEEKQASTLSDAASKDPSEAPASCTSDNAQAEGEAAQCYGYEQDTPSSSQNSWEAPHLGREGCRATGADTAADRVGRKEHIHRSSQSVQVVPDEVREFLQGRRLAVASCRKLRRGFGRLLGYHVPGQQISKRRREDCRSHGVQFPRTARPSDKKQASFEGMEEGATTKEQTANAGHSNGRYGHGYAGKRKASPCSENGGRLRHLPTSWRVRRLERKRCGDASSQSRAHVSQVHDMLIVRDQEEGVPDKVGIFDNSISLDTPSRSYLGPLLEKHINSMKNKCDPLYPFTNQEFRKEFAMSCKKIGLEGLHPYQMRHGGASEDLGMGIRDHAAVKSRGRWFTDQSVRRYAKIGKIQQMISRLSPPALEYCQWSLANLERAFKGLVPAKAA
jgi:hypothetical protein